MNGERYLMVLLAVCCISAVGVAATTLDSSLQEDPDDVIDFDYDDLPLGKEEAGTVKRETEKNKDDQNTAGSATSDDPGGEEEGGASQPSDGSETTGGGTGDPNEDQGGKDPGDAPGGSKSGDTGSTGTGGVGSALGLGQVPGQFAETFDWLRYLLALLALLVLALLVYRYRERLLALVLAVEGIFADRTPERERATHTDWPRQPPNGDVEGAWLAMVQRLDLDRPYARTTSECARAAIDAGLNPDAVRSLTAAFEEVRYGTAGETDDHRRRARDGLRNLDGGGSR
jgi:hypothetical protein